MSLVGAWELGELLTIRILIELLTLVILVFRFSIKTLGGNVELRRSRDKMNQEFCTSTVHGKGVQRWLERLRKYHMILMGTHNVYISRHPEISLNKLCCTLGIERNVYRRVCSTFLDKL